MSLDRASFLAGMRRLAGGITIITTGRIGHRFGLTATAVASVSADPPTLLICVNKESESYHPIRQHAHFAVNVLGRQHQALAFRFGGAVEFSGEPRFDLGDWVEGALGVPVLADAAASFECELDMIHDGMSHLIFLGRVRVTHARDGVEPIIWVNGGMAVPNPLPKG